MSRAAKTQRRIVVTIQGGVLTGVFTDGDPEKLQVELLDFDNLNDTWTPEDQEEVRKFEAEIDDGTLHPCW